MPHAIKPDLDELVYLYEITKDIEKMLKKALNKTADSIILVFVESDFETHYCNTYLIYGKNRTQQELEKSIGKDEKVKKVIFFNEEAISQWKSLI